MDLEYIQEFRAWASKTQLTYFKNTCFDYVRWQNKATQFYVSARLLYVENQISPSAFCAFQSLENLMKATVMFYTDVATAEAFEHSLKKMERTINNKIVRPIIKTEEISIPNYFVYESRFQSASRYPKRNKGIGFGDYVINDLDKLFLDLIVLVPFQYNTVLTNILFSNFKRYERENEIISRNNQSLSKL